MAWIRWGLWGRFPGGLPDRTNWKDVPTQEIKERVKQELDRLLAQDGRVWTTPSPKVFLGGTDPDQHGQIRGQRLVLSWGEEEEDWIDLYSAAHRVKKMTPFQRSCLTGVLAKASPIAQAEISDLTLRIPEVKAEILRAIVTSLEAGSSLGRFCGGSLEDLATSLLQPSHGEPVDRESLVGLLGCKGFSG